jgi:formate dehydrogenase major subunit
MRVGKRIGSWPVYRQLTGADRRGLGAAAKADHPHQARTSIADSVVKSVCPYCAVGCGQDVYVKDAKVIQIEGDPDSPVSRSAGRVTPEAAPRAGSRAGWTSRASGTSGGSRE